MDVSVANYPGADNIATNQVSVTSAATAIVAARATRRSVLIINHGTTAAVYGIVVSSSQTVSYIENYD